MSTPPPTQSTEDRPSDPAREQPARSGTPADERGAADPRPELAEVARLRERVDELEAALERKDEELDAVRRQYESLLQGRDGGDGGAMTWRTGGEQWAEDVELEYANCDPDAATRREPVEDSGGGRLRSLLR